MIVMAVLLLRGTGIICGRIAGSFFGLHDTRLVSEASWVGIPEGGYEGINLNFGTDFQVLLPVFVLVMVVSSIKTVGEIIAIQRVSWRNPRATDFRITQVAAVANSVGSVLRVHNVLKKRAILSLPAASRDTGLSFPTVASAMELLVMHGVAREITGRSRNRLFAYDQYLSILNEGTEVS